MDNNGDHDAFPKLPESQPEDTLRSTQETYQKVNEALDILGSKLRAACKNQNHQWSRLVLDAKLQETIDRPVIGIVGATGAGKSALINAVLDEECLVPTSCMQACTATIIEVAYNDSTLHSHRAIVEFVAQEVWRTEILKLLEDTTCDSVDPEDDTSEAAIALAKLSAVYPDLNRNNLSDFKIDELLERPGLELLGTSLEVHATTGRELNTKLRRYTESKEKALVPPESKQSTQHYASHDIDYWPLIRKVSIYVKKAALETGCVLLDLPGVADINAARASIARDYLAKCASLWVVVPIVRAVDDKVGRHLLGESFKRQLRRDGKLGRIAIVCSKADLAYSHEIREHFKSDSIFKADMQKIEVGRQNYARLKEQVIKEENRARENSKSIQAQISSHQSEHDAYAKLLVMARDGEKVHPPICRTSKRTATTEEASCPKRANMGDIFSVLSAQYLPDGGRGQLTTLASGYVPKERNFSTTHVQQDKTQPVIGVAELQNKLETLRKSLQKLHMEQKVHEDDLIGHRESLEQIQRLSSYFAEHEWAVCHAARNKYVSEVLKHDFKLGIRDLERAEIEQNPDFDPRTDFVKSSEQQIDLPVFCIASQAYQYLCGNIKDELAAARFTNKDQTGIPDLRRYCVDMGRDMIRASRAASPNSVSQLLGTVILCARSSDKYITTSQPAGTRKIQEITEKLVEDITDMFKTMMNEIELEISHVAESLTEAARTGEKQTMEIVQGWGASPGPGKSGLHHQTYKAVLRRGGIFEEKKINWIDELTALMTHSVDSRWNPTFSTAIPHALKKTEQACHRLIDKYLTALKQNHQFSEVSDQGRKMFRLQFRGLKSKLVHVLNETKRAISDEQQKANRVLGDTIKAELEPHFHKLAKCTGRGAFSRVKLRLEKKVEEIKSDVFNKGARDVFNALSTLLDEPRQDTHASLQKALEKPRRDYQSLFAKQSRSRIEIPKNHRAGILNAAHDIEELLGIETEEVKVEAASPLKDVRHPKASSFIHVKNEHSPQVGKKSLRVRLKIPRSVASSSGIAAYPGQEEGDKLFFGKASIIKKSSDDEDSQYGSD